MPFPANVLRVMIASPIDASEEHGIVTEEIYRWNDGNAVSRKLMLHPVRWERRGAERNGARAQTAPGWHNLEEADILIGIFDAQTGIASEESIHGVVEAIKRHVGAGKTARIYFSETALSSDQIETELYHALLAFQEECRVGGLAMTYGDLETFQGLFRQYLALELTQPRYTWLPEPSPALAHSEPALSEDATRMLISAAAAQGVITTAPAIGGEIVRIGRETLSDGSPRMTAILKEALQELRTRGYLEPMGGKPGNYCLTASGYRTSDKLMDVAKMLPGTEPGCKARPVALPWGVASGKSTRQ